MKLSKDLREFVALLNSAGVECLLVGATPWRSTGIPGSPGILTSSSRCRPRTPSAWKECSSSSVLAASVSVGGFLAAGHRGPVGAAAEPD